MEKILISKFISKELRSRTEAKKILSKVMEQNTTSITFDFSEVVFMSRSFADELCNTFNELEKKKIKVQTINKCDIIDLIFNIVEANRGNRKKVKENSQVKEFSDIDELSSFLSTI